MKTIAGILTFAAAAVVFAVTCTDAGLQDDPRVEVAFVDSLLDIEGQYCTSPAEEMEFPVKILVVMDQSASLQCTDLEMTRRTAIQQLVAELRSNPAVSFGYLGFHAAVYRVGFTSPDDFEAQVAENIVQVGPATDYQGALSTALQMLEQDMVNSPMSMRARTKYVVLFVSDGVPEPRCNAGCEDDDETCSDGIDNDGDGLIDGDDPDCADTLPDRLYGVCNTDEDIPEDNYVDMRSTCPEYNMQPQVLRRIDDIMALAPAYGVGDLRLHTVFLFATQEVVEARCGGAAAADFAYVRDEAMPLMQSMADAGEGTFREVNTVLEREANFFRVDYQPLESSFDLMETFAVNTNSLPSPTGPRVDTDGDGIDDPTEFEEGLDRFRRDTDGDGWSDLFELRFRHSGFDPLDGNRPRQCCPAYGLEGTCCTAPSVCRCPTPPLSAVELADLDGDGLNAAEERFLGTDERDPDSDGDRIPDGLEFRLGLDPTVPDALSDHDFDGMRTRDEIRAATDPQVPDAARAATSGVRQRIVDIGEDSLRRHCYSFEIRGIELVQTLEAPGADGLADPVTQGRNRIYLMMTEEPVELAGHRGNLFIGCVEATYLGGSYKDPPDGRIDLTRIQEACYRACYPCDSRETLQGCRDRCLSGSNPGACLACDVPCSLFHESEVFVPEIHCVSPMCVDPLVWGTSPSGEFACLDNCEADGWCNCHCPNDCDCNPYRSERCTTVRACR